MKGQGTEAWLRTLLMAWCRRYPKKAEAYFAELRERKARDIPNGVSREGTMGLALVMPTEIFALINRVDPEFFGDQKKKYLAQQVFMGDLAPLNKGKDFHIIDRSSV